MQDKSYLVEWRERVGNEEADRITNESLRRGTRFHAFLEEYLANKKELVTDYLTLFHFLQVKKELESLLESIYALEIPLYSDVLKVAGRCDCIAQIDGRPFIVDFKTSKKEKDLDEIENYRFQCSAYAVMANERFGLGIKDYCILISNLHENHPTVVFGKVRDHLPGFVNVRRNFA